MKQEVESWIEISWYVIDDFQTFRDNKIECFVHKIEIPRYMLEKWQWLITWRTSKYQCLNPRKKVINYYCYYDKKTGLDNSATSLLQKYTSAKAQLTKIQNVINRYKSDMSKTLFQDFEHDEIYKKLICKLENKKQLLIDIEEQLKYEEPIKTPTI